MAQLIATADTTTQDIQNFLDENEGVAIVAFYTDQSSSWDQIQSSVYQETQNYGIPLILVDAGQADDDLLEAYRIQERPVVLLIQHQWDNVKKKAVRPDRNKVRELIKDARR